MLPYVNDGVLFFRVGEITLQDIKNLFDRPGSTYRYHFKNMDPEFGTVKEEVIICHHIFMINKNNIMVNTLNFMVYIML